MSSRTILSGLLIVIACGAMMLANTRFDAPPRYDGAGYAVLARSIGEGRGYREIDHPDAPRHAHFPPGYPLALAGVWKVTGVSWAAAHAFSFVCTIGACLVFWRWTRRWARPAEALIMAFTLAINWRWGRDGAAIQSEPLFALLSIAAVSWSGKVRGGFVLGILLGAIILTRHAGVALVVAIFLDLVLRSRKRDAAVALITCIFVVAPWAIWLAIVGKNTQVGLVPVQGVGSVIAHNALFYLQRLIDTLIGPVIEVATVFRPNYAGIATAAAIVLAAPIVWGWVRLARSHDRRLAGLVPMLTMPMLLVWPFTEAGRFLVPLIPFIIAGAVEGIGALIGKKPHHIWAAILVLAMSFPYSLYSVVTDRAASARETHAAFDAACAWIAHQNDPNGPVLTRHPGEVFIRTGRTAISPTDDVAKLIDTYNVAFLLIDDARYANAPASPLGKFVITHPDRVEQMFGSEVLVYRILK